MKPGIVLVTIFIIVFVGLSYSIYKEKQNYLEKIRTGQIEVHCDDIGLANQNIEDVIFIETGPVFRLKGRQDYIICDTYSD